MSIKLPFTFIATGILTFIFFQIENAVSLAGWMSHHPRNSLGWTQVHLLVLGWATMIAMGAVYQLIHVVLQRNIYSTRLGYIHFAFYSIGTIGLLIGFFHFNSAWIGAFAVLAAIGIILFVLNTVWTIVQAKQWNPITLSTLFALIYLALTAIVGVLMGLNFAFQFWGGFHDRLLSAHIWMGSLGWFGLLISGVSYKMLPMFYLSHNQPTQLQHLTLWLWNGGVLLGAMCFLFDLPQAFKLSALLLVVCAVGCYNGHIQQIIKFRHKPTPGAGILFAVWSARALFIVALVAFCWLAVHPRSYWDISALQLMMWAYLWGFVAITILGYMSKIIPFLWWTYKYGNQVGKKKVPVLADMLKDSHIRFGLGLVTTGFALLLVGLMLSTTILIQWGGTLLSLASLIYIFMIALVFTK